MCKSKNHTADEHKAKLTAARLASPKWRKAVSEAAIATHSHPHTSKHNANIAKGVQKAYEDPALHEKLSTFHEQRWAAMSDRERAELAEKIAAPQRGREFTPEHLAAIQEANSKPRTPEHRAKLSEACKGRSGKSPDPEIEAERVRKIIAKQKGHIPRYGKEPFWYESGDRCVAMRSSWEVAYAKFLDSHGWEWQYEPKAFDLGDSTYTPDFYLPLMDAYVEIKGYLTRANKFKIDRFRELYPNVGWKLLEKSGLESLGMELPEYIPKIQRVPTLFP